MIRPVALFCVFTILLGANSMASAQNDSGIVQIPLQHSVADTLDRLAAPIPILEAATK